MESIYYDPALGLASVEKLHQRVKQLGISISKAEIRKFLKEQEAEQVFARRKVKYHYPLISYSPFSRIQIDLLDVSQLAHWNSGTKFLFVAVDVFTRYAWVLPLKSKEEEGALAAFKQVVADIEERRGFPPVQVDSDQEASFLSRKFQTYCEDKLISQKLLPLDDFKGTAVVERFNRTIRELLNRYLVAYSTKKYLNVLGQLVVNYNSRVNDGIQAAPNDAAEDPDFERNYWRLVKNKIRRARGSAIRGGYSEVKVGDRVRVLLRRKTFDKGTNQRWSSSLHTVQRFEDGLYFVSDRVAGYKAYELQRVGEVARLPRDEAAAAALEAEVEQVAAERRLTRAMNKEGIAAAASASAPREARERRPRDFGPVIVG